MSYLAAQDRGDLAIGLVTAFWLSAWMPLPPDPAFVVAAFFALAAIIFTLRAISEHSTSRKVLAWVFATLGAFALLFGLPYALLAAAAGTYADGYLAAYQAIGWTALAIPLAGRFGFARLNSKRLILTGSLTMIALATLSWGSAARMKLHAGAVGDTSSACILMPISMDVYAPVTALRDMRLPAFASTWTGPTGTVTLSYHALLLVPGPGAPAYNWSKTAMRFEVLDRKRNPYIPDGCPD